MICVCGNALARSIRSGSCSYAVLWNAFKVIAAGYSADEKTALFSGAASDVYRLKL
jgi:L-fuconolactonase